MPVRPLRLVYRAAANAFELALDLFQLLVSAILQIDQLVPRPFLRADQLIELQVQRLGVAVLRVLDQEHHQERHDRRPGVDDQLPRIRKVKERSRGQPSHDQCDGQRQCRRAAALVRHPSRDALHPSEGAPGFLGHRQTSARRGRSAEKPAHHPPQPTACPSR